MSVASEAIERLVARLKEFGLPYTLQEGHLSIEPNGPNTFPIKVRDDVVEATIHACNWHAHFDDPDAVVSCVSSLLTPFARIVEQYAGNSFEGAWVEVYDSNGWSGPLENFWTIRPPKFVSRLLAKSQRHVFFQ